MQTGSSEKSNNESGHKHKSGISTVVKHNIRSILRHRLKAARKRSLQERIADAITRFSGTMGFVYLHILWFSVWILLNTGRFGIRPFDPYPYGLLTMVVSLEAIFLSAFVLISQNRMSREADESAELDLQINLLTQYELTRALQMLDAIQKKMDIHEVGERELTELETEIEPEDILNEIERNQEQLFHHKP